MTEEDEGDSDDEPPIYTLANVQNIHAEEPNFKVPAMQDLNAIKVGDYIRAVFEYLADANGWSKCNKERLWMRVEHHDPRSGRILGLLISDPVCINWDQLRWGDQVALHQVNVLQIDHKCPSWVLN